MKMALQIKDTPSYPFKSLVLGFKRRGIEFKTTYSARPPEPDTTLITWTLWSHMTKRLVADAHTSSGGKTLCMENAWIASMRGTHWQLAFRVGYTSGINGFGEFPFKNDGGARWESFKIPVTPWRKDGGHILVCPQRGVRPQDPDITHGSEWTESIMARVRAMTDRPIIWRPHPGAPGKATLPSTRWRNVTVMDPNRPLTEGFKDAFACVVYSSTSATDAILNGIPVVYDGPSIMCKNLAIKFDSISSFDDIVTPDREPELHQLAYMQWSSEELAWGAPWRLI